MKKIIAGFVIGVVFAIGVLADSCVSVTASHVNVFVVFLFSGNSDFNELALHLQTEMQMTASSNQVHIIKKPPYVGIAHVLDSGKSILMQIDEGTVIEDRWANFVEEYMGAKPYEEIGTYHGSINFVCPCEKATK